MFVLSAREFRANHGVALNRANNGEDVLITSRYGTFKITPVTEEDRLAPRMEARIKGWLSQVEDIKQGKAEVLTEDEFWNEL